MTSGVIPGTSIASVRGSHWSSVYHRKLIATDAFAVIWGVMGAQLLWFGVSGELMVSTPEHSLRGIPYWFVSIVLAVFWFLVLGWSETHDVRLLGEGGEEYRRVTVATFVVFGVVAILGTLLRLEFARGYLLTAMPLGLAALLGSRWYWRQQLVAQRERGEAVYRCVLAGSATSAARIAHDLGRATHAGYQVVGAILTSDGPQLPAGFPVERHSAVDHVLAMLERTNADTVIVVGGDGVRAEDVRELGWKLEGTRWQLVVAPAVMDVAGARLRKRPVAGLPLLHIEAPELSRGARAAKRFFDVLIAAVTLVVVSPVMVAIALGIRRDSPGPVLFAQERMGYREKPFRMLKFRTMVADAEEHLEEVRALQNAGNAVMFKAKDDPRVTKLGAFLRRYSLDELPQLFNVLRGEMSLVGPRPPLLSEVEKYESSVHRRFLVKPGITGLWQISGRSELSWEDTVRIDLYYVENWKLFTDGYILARTIRVVLGRKGAY